MIVTHGQQRFRWIGVLPSVASALSRLGEQQVVLERVVDAVLDSAGVQALAQLHHLLRQLGKAGLLMQWLVSNGRVGATLQGCHVPKGLPTCDASFVLSRFALLRRDDEDS